MKKFTNFIFVILFFTIAPNIFAWDATGHKIIAAIAYENLTPETKAKVDQLTCLFDKSNQNGYCSQSPNAAKARFMFDATWADLLRGENVPDFDNWHFTDNPRNPKNPKNVVWAINKSKHVLAKWQYDIYAQAIYFRFLLHFAGDAHQPLHCIEHNDRGGNLVPINSKYADNLHEYWDRGLGEFCSRNFYQIQQHDKYQNYASKSQCTPLSKKELFKLVNYIEYKYPKNYFGDKVNDLNPKNWAIESYDTAVNFAYDLKANQKPTYQYDKKGRAISLERMALAGYRLANLLNNITFKTGSTATKPLTETEAITEVSAIEK